MRAYDNRIDQTQSILVSVMLVGKDNLITDVLQDLFLACLPHVRRSLQIFVLLWCKFCSKVQKEVPYSCTLAIYSAVYASYSLVCSPYLQTYFSPQISIFAQEDVLQFFLEFAVENFSLPTFYFWLEINDSGTIFPFGGNSNAI